MTRDDESSFARWSRRKAEASKGAVLKAEPAAPEAVARDAGRTASIDAVDGRTTVPDAAADSVPNFSSFDFDALDARSDYTQFMGKSVPDDVRNKALRKLWSSDPALSLHDGLDDCCGDYTDARWAVGEISTIYRIGKGLLSDEEIAAWERLGRPLEQVSEAAASDDAEAEVASDEVSTAPARSSPPAATPGDDDKSAAG